MNIIKGNAPTLPCSSNPSAAASEGTIARFNMDEILNCMHCGFCLPACPTYTQTGLETYSPRGRIALMKGVASGHLAIDAEFEQNMNACLGCRACETACPAGVPYGGLLETARAVVSEQKYTTEKPTAVRNLVFKQLFPHPKRVKRLGTLLWTAQALGLQKLAARTGLIRILPRPMAELQGAVSTVASPWKRAKRQPVMQAENQKVVTVGLFTGCIMDILFYDTNEATARLLTKAGCEVVFIKDQGCCGAMHAHSGEMAGAKALAKANIEAFERAGVDYLVNNAGGCGAALKEYGHWFQGDPVWEERAARFARANRDASEMLAELPPLSFTKPIRARVTYQDSCHLAHGQGVRSQPREMLRRIPGLELIEMRQADSCCGSAGTYNLTQFEMSMQILDDKMVHAEATQANIIATSNPGCLLQMKQGILRAGLEDRMEAVHIMDLLHRAL